MTKKMEKKMNKVEIEVSGQPQGKGRPRFTRTGRAYTPSKTKEYEGRIKAATWAVMRQQSRVATDKPVYVEIIAFMRYRSLGPRRKGLRLSLERYGIWLSRMSTI
jgi:Holliday junction resolvase RusA-like endonuclease